jgi:hypothetical protein
VLSQELEDEHVEDEKEGDEEDEEAEHGSIYKVGHGGNKWIEWCNAAGQAIFIGASRYSRPRRPAYNSQCQLVHLPISLPVQSFSFKAILL